MESVYVPGTRQGTSWHRTTGHRPLRPQQKNSIPRHPQRVRHCQ